TKSTQLVRPSDRRCPMEKSDHRHRRLLPARRERPRHRCAAYQRDELPAPHSRPQGSKPRTASSHSRPGLGTGRGGCELRPIVLAWECRLRVPRPGQNRKGSESAKCFPLSPRKQTSLPILELLPPPTLGERRHGSLARRGVAVRRCAVLVVSERERPHP